MPPYSWRRDRIHILWSMAWSRMCPLCRGLDHMWRDTLLRGLLRIDWAKIKHDSYRHLVLLKVRMGNKYMPRSRYVLAVLL
ncbi:hypothetical protein F4804DRAFT_296211 [Jackrogersella minutella]|nr:hypothetical protein F4804DRAFT_296211 [Jackrogersella minutella]